MSLKRPLPQNSAAVKRKKISHPSNDKVDALETELTEAISRPSASLNSLADLIALASSENNASISHHALYALYRIFVLIISGGRLTAPAEEGSDAFVVKSWLKDRLTEYVDLLCTLLHHKEPAIRTASLEILMSLLKALSTSLSVASSQHRLDASHFNKIVRALLIGPSQIPSSDNSLPSAAGGSPQDVRDLFLEKWLSVHDDVRWFFLRESASILRSSKPTSPPSSAAQNLLSLLERLITMPTEQRELNEFWISELSKRPSTSASKGARQPSPDEEADPDDWLAYFDDPKPATAEPKERLGRPSKLSTLQSLHSLPSHRAVFSHAWLALLPHLSSPALAARALGILHKSVLPHFTRPLRLMDWISGCVDYGGAIGLLALNALFTLMKNYNLDYPNFYTRLYGFLTRDLLHFKYRARFFRLAELFLSSTHLPATLLASFVKRLSRLSLSAPPAAIVMIIPFIYNILKQHPVLMVLIHRDVDSFDTDPFNPDVADPLTTDALSSSLWELASHREHYLASVSTMARVLAEAFTKPSYSLEDFLDHTYGTLFEAESKRNIKKEPALAIAYEGQLFPPRTTPLDADDADGSRIGDVVAELWGFA